VTKQISYEELAGRLEQRLSGERDFLACAANTTAFIFQHLPDLNWVGVYLLRDGDLLLGPFQGLPARARIPLAAGLCGRAARERRVVRAEDVHACPDHIACDPASRSEIVLPIERGDELIGVLDIDSPQPARFGPQEERGLLRLVAVLLEATRPQETESPRAQFLYRLQVTRPEMLTAGPTAAESASVARHFAYLQELARRGVVLLAGRTLNSDASSFGLVILEAQSQREATEIMRNDPAVRDRVMRAEIFPYRIALMTPRRPT
jgi:GAF domain-containing protein